MGKQLTDLTFEEWLIYVFDHPVEAMKNAWYWHMDRDWWAGPAGKTVEFLTRAFEQPAEAFKPYTDAQLKQGLWFLVSPSCSNHMLALSDGNVPWPERQRCIRSFHSLYAGCFAQRCTPHLSHIDEPGAGPLNAVCYMWWDLIPLYGQPENPAQREMDKVCLDVMESTLGLDSIACRESALHGLGHWQYAYPKRVRQIIDNFSMQERALTEPLKTYLLNAYRGHVL